MVTKKIDTVEIKKDVKKSPKKKQKMSKSTMVLIIGCVLLIIPFAILFIIILQASFNTGEPILGERFEGDLDPAITDEMLTELKGNLDQIEGVDGVEINLKTATLRVYLDASDDITDEQAQELIQKAYDELNNEISIDTYFKATTDKKMYDLEIHLYNSLDKAETEDYIYYICNKTSNMLEPKTQLVSKPLNPDLAEELRQDVENRLNPTPTPSAESEVNVSSEEEVTEE